MDSPASVGRGSWEGEMKDLKDRALQLVKAGIYGYLIVALSILCAVLVAAVVALLTGAASFDLGVGPVPLATYWRSGASYGFASGSGVWLFGILGALVGLGLELRRQVIRTA